MKRVLEQLRHVQKKGTIIMCDNSSTIKLSKNPVMHGRSKHIDVCFHFLREFAKDRIVELLLCRMKERTADVMTKPLKLDSFQKFRSQTGICKAAELN